MIHRTNLLCLAGGFLAGSLGLLLSDSIVTPAAAAQEGGGSNTQKPDLLFGFCVPAACACT
jgi:hypothetical protein